MLFLTKYELCCVNDNNVDVSFVFVCFVKKNEKKQPLVWLNLTKV